MEQQLQQKRYFKRWFRHMQPWTLFNEDNGNNSRGQKCMACEKPILMGPTLGCTESDFVRPVFLHKSCELPLEMNHFAHPDHPLYLLDFSEAYDFRCYACEQSISNRFVYQCSSRCRIELDVGCARLAQTMENSTLHQHPLTLHLKPCSFCCDACGIKHEQPGLIYLCSSCSFWVHSDCASLPTRIEHTSHHPHPLTLVSPWNKSEIYKFRMYCDICSKEVGEKNCIYYCADCTYFAHLHCATSVLPAPADTKSHQDPGVVEDHPQLPMPDESSSRDLANSLIEELSLLGASDQVGRGLKEGRCDHNLTLLDAQTNEVCDACVRPISTPYYNCSQCHFILHKSCAELPSEIQDNGLILQEKLFFWCQACGRGCNGFSYSFRIDRREFDLDINCASLPATIRHEAHEHPLNLVKDESDEWCSSCHESCDNIYKFRCRDCKFNLHIQCAFLPKTLRHIYDRHHALILKYTPVGIKREEYYCEICEEEMNTKLWFYYCADCNYAFHSKCLCTAAHDYANLKPGLVFKARNHPHPVTGVRNAKFKRLCGKCRGPLGIGDLVFQCKGCEFILHFSCA